jgi:hypothetical protein
MAFYQVENQWGGPKAPWHEGGVWMMGRRPQQYLTYVNMKASADSPMIMHGELAYGGEQKVTCRAEEVGWNKWAVQVQVNGNWQDDGIWIMGDRFPQRTEGIDVSAGADHRLVGTTVYTHEGPIGFKGTVVTN